MTREQWIEENRDAMETAYYKMYGLCVQEDSEKMWEGLHQFEATLVELNILEGDNFLP